MEGRSTRVRSGITWADGGEATPDICAEDAGESRRRACCGLGEEAGADEIIGFNRCGTKFGDGITGKSEGREGLEMLHWRGLLFSALA